MRQEMMQYKGYRGSVEVSLEDNVLYGSIQFIKDLVTYEAENLEQLRYEFELAVNDYLETCRQVGKEPEKEFSGTFNVRVGSEIHKKAAIVATLEGVTLNEFTRRALLQATREADEVIHRHVHEHVFNIQTESKMTFEESSQWQAQNN